MKTEERKKKFIAGLVIYTAGIIQFTVLTVMAIEQGPWLLAFVGLGIYLPASILGSNLMILHRWW